MVVHCIYPLYIYLFTWLNRLNHYKLVKNYLHCICENPHVSISFQEKVRPLTKPVIKYESPPIQLCQIAGGVCRLSHNTKHFQINTYQWGSLKTNIYMLNFTPHLKVFILCYHIYFSFFFRTRNTHSLSFLMNKTLD